MAPGCSNHSAAIPTFIGLNTHLHPGFQYGIDGDGGRGNEEIWTGCPGDVEIPSGEGRNPRDMGHLGALTGGTPASTLRARRAVPLLAKHPHGDGSALGV